MGDEVWTPQDIVDQEGTRRAIKRGLEADKIIPTMNVPETPTGEFENPNTMLQRKRSTEVRET
jgi:hypothetical protein